MALGAYFTTKTEREHYNADIKIKDQKQRAFLSKLDINEQIQNIASGEIIKETERWSDLLSKSEDNSPAKNKAAAIALSYLFGGIVPILPFFIYTDIKTAMQFSIMVTFVSLFITSYIRSKIRRANIWGSTLRILLITGIAAGCAYGLAIIIKG